MTLVNTSFVCFGIQRRMYTVRPEIEGDAINNLALSAYQALFMFSTKRLVLIFMDLRNHIF
jgi:hypothetical protein